MRGYYGKQPQCPLDYLIIYQQQTSPRVHAQYAIFNGNYKHAQDTKRPSVHCALDNTFRAMPMWDLEQCEC